MCGLLCPIKLLLCILFISDLSVFSRIFVFANEAPCSFFDSVNITADTRFENGSYLHDGVLIPPHLVATFDHIYRFGAKTMQKEPHVRGCICQLKPCLNFCCPLGYKYNYTTESCVTPDPPLLWPEPVLNVTLANGGLRSVNIFEQFAVQYYRVCRAMYAWQPEIDYEDQWQLFENGRLLYLHDNYDATRQEYCFVPTVENRQSKQYILNPAVCRLATEYSTVKRITAYGMFISVFFMMLTIIVYLSLPELRNLHGKCLVCYLLGLIIGYTTFTGHTLVNLDAENASCYVIGYSTYFFFMSAFFWLNVISFDLWHSFKGVGSGPHKRFLKYALYAWGLAAAFTVFVGLAQEVIPIPKNYKPGIGDGRYCWLDLRTWSAMIYLFGPMLVIILINTTFFILTFMKIRKVQLEMDRVMANADTSSNIRSERDRVVLFLRLFVIMGVTWLVEIISYLTGWEEKWTKIFYLTDFINAMQGVLIFVLFVMKKSVWVLLKQKISGAQLKSQTVSSTDSTNSNYIQTTSFNGAPIQLKVQ